MGTKATHNARLSNETRAVIGVVLDALDIPHAASAAHDEIRSRILHERVMHLVVILHNILRWNRVADLPADLAHLRSVLDEQPATGYVTDKQARARRAAGETWSESVALDYRGSHVEDERDAAGGGDVTATVPGAWPGGEPSAVRDAADAQHTPAAALAARMVEQIDRNAGLVRRFTHLGEVDLARAFADVSLAWRTVADALAGRGDLAAALDGVDGANARARTAVAAARARHTGAQGCRS